MNENYSVRPINGYFLIPTQRVNQVYAHSLCGSTGLAGAVSPNSGRKLLQLLLLDTNDPRLELEDLTTSCLPLLYSWTCPISDGIFSYRVLKGGVELLGFGEGEPYDDFPYENYPEAFPSQAMDLISIDPTDQETIQRLNIPMGMKRAEREVFAELDRPKHQLGGVPRLMQPVSNVQCKTCRKEMPLLASIANENGSERGFADNEFVQVIYHLCRICSVVSCYNLVD